MASQRVEHMVMEYLNSNFFLNSFQLDQNYERGKLPGVVESTIMIFVLGNILIGILRISSLYVFETF